MMPESAGRASRSSTCYRSRVADSPRIEDLRRRVQKDPASIAFAQLAEELRRAGENQESVETCRAGLAIHPGYLSARVPLGRALIELDQLDEAQLELELVLSTAPENLAAIRGLAEIHHRRGALHEALRHYRAALALARNDPDLERTVTELSREIEPKAPATVIDGLSFEEMANEFMKNLEPPPPPPVAPPPIVPATLEPPAAMPVETAAATADVAPSPVETEPAWAAQAGASVVSPEMTPSAPVVSTSVPEPSDADTGSDTVSDPVCDPGSDTVPDAVAYAVSDAVSDIAPDVVPYTPIVPDVIYGGNGGGPAHGPVADDLLIFSPQPTPEEAAFPTDRIANESAAAVVLSENPPDAAADATPTGEDAAPLVEDATRAHAQATIVALDQWLDAIHVARADRRA
jgi:hypothetical protein